jgi:hypothetical protein
MSTTDLSERDWHIRHYVYTYFVEHVRPPTYAQAAQQFGLAPEEGRLAYQRLHQRHAVFLDPGTRNIRMAHPLSAVPTPFGVSSQGRRYWANCAWDALGIPAMLHADAAITASLASTGETVTYAVQNGRLWADPFCVHFPLPFGRWYDDLVHT